MYLHIGNGVYVRTGEVIALWDYRLFRPAAAASNLDFLAAAGAKGQVISCTEGQEEPKTLVVTEKGLYLSPVSAPTLRRRQQMVFEKR